MNATPDDDALSWAGENDPTLSVDRADRDAPPHDAAPDLTPGPDRGPFEPEAAPTLVEPVSGGARGSAALVLTGILAGIYLLYTIGWFISIGRISNPAGEPVAAFMFSLGTWLAVAAPAIWFGVSYVLTAGQPRIRLTWLIIGVVLLAPVPFILGSGTGS